MKRSFKIAAVVALLVAAPSWAASEMTYTLELGGNNNVGDWDNGEYTPYDRAPNGDDDGQVYSAGDIVSWAALVRVTGTHEDPGGLGDGLLPGGAANMVFDLELREGTAAGPLAAIGAATLDANGQPTSAGWYSSINDGACRGIRCVIQGGASPLLNAAYAIAFNVNGNGASGGRLFDTPASGGPFVDFFHYPSADGRPAAADVDPGYLVGMGAGYKEFKPSGGGGQNVGGVGLLANSDQCIALGEQPVFEGQLDTRGLNGIYVLVLRASVGNNVLPGHDPFDNPICTFGPTGRFAMAPNGVVEDTISFEVSGPSCQDPVLQTAQSVRTHGGTGTFGVDLLSGNRVEPRSGAVKIEAVYDIDVTVSGATASSGTPVASASGNKITVDVTGATPNAPLVVSFNAEDGECSTATSLCVRLLQGDVNDDGTANVLDLVQIRNALNTVPNAGNFSRDVNADGAINVLDLVQVRNNLNQTSAACP